MHSNLLMVLKYVMTFIEILAINCFLLTCSSWWSNTFMVSLFLLIQRYVALLHAQEK
jgi:hypothetical protein